MRWLPGGYLYIKRGKSPNQIDNQNHLWRLLQRDVSGHMFLVLRWKPSLVCLFLLLDLCIHFFTFLLSSFALTSLKFPHPNPSSSVNISYLLTSFHIRLDEFYAKMAEVPRLNLLE